MPNRNNNGFTIVELLIVIVVIAILATITIVVFNGIQTRSKNGSIVQTVAVYAKALQQYKVDNGNHPATTSCLGLGYPSSNCRSDDTTAWVENGGNLNTVTLNPYMKTVPRPSLQTITYSTGFTMSGAFYMFGIAAYNPTGGGIGMVQLGSGDCPTISSLTYVSVQATSDGNRMCRYAVQ